MKVSMKQARRIEREIGAQLEIDTHGRNAFAGRADVSIYENFAAKMDQIQKETVNNVAKMTRLIQIRFAIRKAIETTNETAGINRLMNQEAGLKAIAKILTAAMTGELTADEYKIAAARHDALKSANEKGTVVQSRYGESTDSITVGDVLSEQTAATLREQATAIQRDLLKIVDELSALNATAKIEISDEDVAVLEAANIVV